MANVESQWFGDEIAKEIERATVEGLETVAADFVRTAHPLTPIAFGNLRRSTKWDKVKRHADGSMSLEMGSFDMDHAFLVEKGTGLAKSKGELPKGGADKRPAGAPKIPWYPGGAHMYQQSADQTWPKLGDRIKSALRKPAA